ncbi:MAG: hypothetical protein N4A48_06865 [Tepidibacter sp.]|jgi:hypothetical protein|uniref:nucleotidyltransferase domain-containing protein n=1 Tax=Tepidibacter sp. TaxID=2529387 RepID=UPI0025FEB5B7|nr:hypothetical protein [Tepidibacter sp.]MCT4508470.1 hypothetical protein [Tepidibacter sp.]
MNQKVLKKIAKGLNELNCTWAIGGSVVLNHYGLVEKPNDIDILIDANHADKIKKFMDTIGTYIELPSKEPYKTKEFFGYRVEDTMVEFLGNFKIDLGEDKIYEFILDDDSIKDYMIIDNIKVNLTTLEDWYVAYSVMKDPKKRIPLLREYLKKSGIKYKSLLERNLNQNLPDCVKLDIENILLLK